MSPKFFTSLFCFLVAQFSWSSSGAEERPHQIAGQRPEKLAVVVADQQATNIPDYDFSDGSSVVVVFDGYLLGLKVGEMRVAGQFTDTRYSFDYEMHQAGIGRWFSHLETSSKSLGKFAPGKQPILGTEPVYYRSQDKKRWRGTQIVEMVRSAGSGRFSLYANPAIKFDAPVSETSAKGTVDPIASLMLLGFVNVLPGENPCERLISVFDGKSRFNMRLQPLGVVNLEAKTPGQYSGPAHKCQLFRDHVDGQNDVQMVSATKGNRTAYVYLANVPEEFSSEQLTFMPVVIEAKGVLAVRLNANEVTFTGKP